VTLLIAAAGTLLGSGEGKQYHSIDAIPLHRDSTLNEGNWALLFSARAKEHCHEGLGAIDGQGVQYYSAVRGMLPPSGIGGSKYLHKNAASIVLGKQLRFDPTQIAPLSI
jgi:hypothetical protein